jgi:hypothetical protein
MALSKIGTAGAALILGMAALPAVSEARPLGTVEDMPFFGLPYPNFYVYHPPRMECYVFQQVYDPFEGPKIVPVWVCGPPVIAKY